MSPSLSFSVSIIIPAFNAARTIQECVDSVLAQMSTQHELLVVDDGSLDNTLALLQAAQQAHHALNFRILTQANAGQSAARNHAIEQAQGDYIVLLDADDVLRHDALALIETYIARFDYPDGLTFDYRTWVPEQNNRYKLEANSYTPDVLIEDKKTMLHHFFVDRKMYAWTKIFKRNVYAQVSQPIFPVGRIFEDITAVPRLLAVCNSFISIPHALIDYRTHITSSVKTITLAYCQQLSAALLPVKPLLEKLPADDPLKLSFDVTACYLYLWAIKTSFQIDKVDKRVLHQQYQETLNSTLFFPVQRALAEMQARQEYRGVRQIAQALAHNKIFYLRQTVSGFYKAQRQRRRLKALHAHTAPQPTKLM